MAKIEWTDRSDWNPVRGCTRVSPGCGGPGPHGGCYAEAIAARFSDPGMWGHGFAERTASGPRWTGKVELQEDRLDIPPHWRKSARIFANSTSDFFHEALSDGDIDKIFAVMGACDGTRSSGLRHTFQVLTKRAERMRAYLTDPDTPFRIGAINCKRFVGFTPHRGGVDWGAWTPWPMPNVWLGVSVEDQASADERIPLLLETPAATRFLSCEPLLGPLDLTRWVHRFGGNNDECDGPCCQTPRGLLHWVIAGAESGHGARPCDQNWVRDLRDQCEAAGVPLFYKQHAERGRKIPLPMLDGRQHVAFPVTP